MSCHIWNPHYSTIYTWKPTFGWPHVFSNKDRMECARLFVFFRNTKNIAEEKAEQLAYMVLFKQKYHGMRYTDLQERELIMALRS